MPRWVWYICGRIAQQRAANLARRYAAVRARSEKFFRKAGL